jgi:hypothetical protein
MAQPDERLHYFMDKPFSSQFYLHGKVSRLTDLTDLQDRLASAGHDYYVFQNEVLKGLPATVKARLETVKSYGRSTLFHAFESTEKCCPVSP